VGEIVAALAQNGIRVVHAALVAASAPHAAMLAFVLALGRAAVCQLLTGFGALAGEGQPAERPMVSATSRVRFLGVTSFCGALGDCRKETGRRAGA
jgi:hypothetical protein